MQVSLSLSCYFSHFLYWQFCRVVQVQSELAQGQAQAVPPLPFLSLKSASIWMGSPRVQGGVRLLWCFVRKMSLHCSQTVQHSLCEKDWSQWRPEKRWGNRSGPHCGQPGRAVSRMFKTCKVTNAMWQWIPFNLHYDYAKKERKKERKQNGYESKAN